MIDHDRQVHARGIFQGRPTEVVRYGRASKWFLEFNVEDEQGATRLSVTFDGAVEAAKEVFRNGGRLYPHLSGGRRFDKALEGYR